MVWSTLGSLNIMCLISNVEIRSIGNHESDHGPDKILGQTMMSGKTFWLGLGSRYLLLLAVKDKPYENINRLSRQLISRMLSVRYMQTHPLTCGLATLSTFRHISTEIIYTP